MSQARNASGESTIYQDDSGRWHGYVSMGVKDKGVRDRRHASGQRRADVVKKVRALERKRNAGLASTAGRPGTVEAWLIHYLETIAAPKLRPSTLSRYRLAVRRHLIPKIGHHRLDRLEPEHIEAAYASLRTAGLAPTTILYAHRVLSRALKIAMRRGRVARNVATLVDAPTGSTAEVVPLSLTEARAVLAEARNRRNGARWSVGLALGLRQGEALGMTWLAIDFDAGTLKVGQALQRIAYRHGCGDSCGRRPAACTARELDLPPGFEVERRLFGGMVLVQPKSGAGKRTLGLPAPLVEALRTQRSEQLAERLRAGSAWEDYDLVFTQPNGRPSGNGPDRAEWLDVLAAAELPPARVHDARHTAATLLLVQGVSARTVMDIMGWSDQRMLLRYQHVIDELRHDAADRMGEALWGELATTLAPRAGRRTR